MHVSRHPPAARFRRWTIPAVAALTLVLGGLLAPPAVVRGADNPNNIPGVPLPGSVVTGQLGGSVYDVVYRVLIPAGHVLIASMTGSAGTDFDMYLFNSSARDIYADPPVGQVASSTGPTSTEQIQYPSISGGMYYIDLSAFNPAPGTYRLAVRIAADTTPPRVSVTLDGGAPATNNPRVTATVIATDDLSGVDSVQFSADGTAWTAWTPYQTTVQWSFGPPNGTKELWVRARDYAGNVSASVHATITLDTTPPTVIARDPGPNGTTSGLQPSFSVQFSEPISVPTWDNAGFILQAPGGQVVYGSYGYDAQTNTGTFVPNDPLIPGAAYTASVGSVTDVAGNSVPPIGSWTVTPLLASTLTLKSSARVLAAAGTVELRGGINLWSGGPMNLESSADGRDWTVFQPLIPGPDGTFVAEAQVDTNVYFRVHYGGTNVQAEGVSRTVRVLVRREVRLVGVDPGVTRRVALGSGVTLTAQVRPVSPTATVSFKIYRQDATGIYRYVGSFGRRTDAAGRATIAWRPTVRGRYYVRVVTLPSSAYANGTSPAYRWAVY